MNKQGFTLVETIIYTLLIGVLFTAFISFSLTMAAARAKNTAMQRVNLSVRQGADVVKEKLSYATVIIAPLAGAASTSITFIDKDNNTIIIREQAGTLWLISEGQDHRLTNSRVTISNTEFKHLAGNSIRFSWQADSKAAGSREFRTTTQFSSAVTIKP